MNGKGSEVLQSIWNAKPYRPDGIVAGVDLYDKCVTDIDDLKDSVEYPWKALQEKLKESGMANFMCSLVVVEWEIDNPQRT